MRLRGILAIVMIIAGAVVTTPVRAVTFDLVYTAALPNNANFTAEGGGSFSAPDKPSIGLPDLTAFFFTWSNFGFGGAPPVPLRHGVARPPVVLGDRLRDHGDLPCALDSPGGQPKPGGLGAGILQRHQPGAGWCRDRTMWESNRPLSASWSSPSE